MYIIKMTRKLQISIKEQSGMFKFLIEVLQYISEVLSFKCYLDDKTETFELFFGNNRTHKMKVFKIKIFAFIVASFAFFIDVVEFIFG